ncbi:MAG: hypothetical protein P4N59_11515 [Negativicutes bacterium]|nr:hypothetical protein [Negativicutes bacterium]
MLALPGLIGYASQLLFDKLPDVPGIGYGFARQLSAADRQPAMLVTRSSDNTSEAFGYKNGLLDAASILSFCGGSTGTVAQVYNKGTLGSAGDGLQATQSNQPVIVNAGVLVTNPNGTAALQLFASPGNMGLQTAGPTVTNVANPSAIIAVAALNNLTSSGGIAGDTGASYCRVIRAIGANLNTDAFYGSTTQSNVFLANSPAIVEGQFDFGNYTAGFNGAFVNGGSSQLDTSLYTAFSIGFLAGWNSSGPVKISEVLEYTNNVVSTFDQQTYRMDQARAFGIAGVI